MHINSINSYNHQLELMSNIWHIIMFIMRLINPNLTNSSIHLTKAISLLKV